jgi:hypothetical protein
MRVAECMGRHRFSDLSENEKADFEAACAMWGMEARYFSAKVKPNSDAGGFGQERRMICVTYRPLHKTRTYDGTGDTNWIKEFLKDLELLTFIK